METTTETPAATEETAPQEATPEPARTDPPEQNLVGEAKRKQKQAEKEARDLRERLEALEDRDKSETERERKAREKAEARAQELEGEVQSLKKGGWVRSAAKDFNDPSDAVAMVDLADIDDESDAARAVKDLAKRKPHLVKAKEPTPPQIGRVAQDGQVQGGARPQSPASAAKEQQGNAVWEAIQAARK